MNINDIISEELSAAQERIKFRVAALLLGGSADAAPVAASIAAPVKRPPASPNEVEATVQKLLAFIKTHPGCTGRELMTDIGVASRKDSRYQVARKRLTDEELIVTRGKGQHQRIWFNDKVSAPTQKPKMERADSEARAKIIVAWYKKHPNSSRRACAHALANKPKCGHENALMSAIQRMVNDKALLKKYSKTITQSGKPAVELRAP